VRRVVESSQRIATARLIVIVVSPISMVPS
jgi:hypothetical protein